MAKLDIDVLFDSKTESKALLGAFLIFHRDNPGVWDQIVEMCRRLKDKGRKHYSIVTIVEVIRHHTNLGYSDQDRDFKINNNHRSAYSRIYMHHYGPFFEIRTSYFERLDAATIQAVYEEFAP